MSNMTKLQQAHSEDNFQSQKEIESIEIYTLDGKCIFSENNIFSNQYQLPFSINQSLVIIRVNHSFSKKIFIH